MTAALDRVRRLLNAPPPDPIPGQAALDVPTAPKPRTCDTGRPLCGAPARLYPAGWRCDQHRPHTIRPEENRHA